MAGEGGDQGPDNGGEGQGAGGDKGGDKGFTPVTYNSQEELNAAFADRASRAKNEVLKVLPEGKTLEDVLSVYTAAQKAENDKKDELTKERERADAAEKKAQTYEQQQAREKLAGEVAANVKVGDKAIPPSLLRGNTKEELEASANEIKAFCETLVPAPRAPGYNPFQGGGSAVDGNQQVQKVDPLRSYFETGAFQ